MAVPVRAWRGGAVGALVLGVGSLGLGGQAPTPRTVQGSAANGLLALSNDLVGATWPLVDGHLGDGRWTDLAGHQELPDLGGFHITLAGGTVLSAADLTVSDPPRVMPLSAHGGSSRQADRFAGQEIVVGLAAPAIAGPVT
jgi:hypothetical protein